MSLLTMVQNAAPKCGLQQPSGVVSSTDPNVVLLRTLADEEGELLSDRHEWQAQKKTATHTTVAANLQGSMDDIAPGWRRIVNDTMWNDSIDVLYVPLDDQRWREFQDRPYGLIRGFRIVDNNLYILEAPTAGQTIKFEYVTRYYCENNVGTEQAAWAADTDVGILPERLMRMGLVWRWREVKGLDYLGREASYHEAVTQAIIDEKPAPVLDMSRAVADKYYAYRGVRVVP